ncbi:hypothetical protein EJ05DRAFT_483383 [Pseudovirgaria hyperparasitica]|uniref:Uncharacterized protein n=1 Tax=Pseudovirgaria hyperparasitica TaxID=470096 RepID=A0A6A6WDR2_9PEZI|nr:uncharacterized protein EJ05DRAFT_483383 [Pseudovirgaria hyperparasitica]KAF2760958.1 hypothetical protein EJ05DRAFT_483383 [Pseudovirgaria hyperparasitica]
MTTPTDALAVLLQYTNAERIFVSGSQAPLVNMDRLRAPDYYFVGRYLYDGTGKPMEAFPAGGGVVSLRYIQADRTKSIPPWIVRNAPSIPGTFSAQMRVVDIVGRNCLRQDAIDMPTQANAMKSPMGPLEHHGLQEGDPITFRALYMQHGRGNFPRVEYRDKFGGRFWIPKWVNLLLEERAMSADVLRNLSRSTRPAHIPVTNTIKPTPPVDTSRPSFPTPFKHHRNQSQPRVGHHALLPTRPSTPAGPSGQTPQQHQQQQGPIMAPIYVAARMMVSKNFRGCRYEDVLLVKTPDGRRVLEVKPLPDNWASDPRNPFCVPAAPTPRGPDLAVPGSAAAAPAARASSGPPSVISSANADLSRYTHHIHTNPTPTIPSDPSSSFTSSHPAALLARSPTPHTLVAPAVEAWRGTGPFEHMAPDTGDFPAGLRYWVCNGPDGKVYLLPLGMRDQWQREMPVDAARTLPLEVAWPAGVPVPEVERRPASVTQSEVLLVEEEEEEEGGGGEIRGLGHRRIMSRKYTVVKVVVIS